MGRKVKPKKNAKKHGKNHPGGSARHRWNRELKNLKRKLQRRKP